MGLPTPSPRELVDGTTSASELAERGGINRAVKSAREVSDEYGEFTAEMKKATIEGLTGAVEWNRSSEAYANIGNQTVPGIRRNDARRDDVAKALDTWSEMTKSAGDMPATWDNFAKEWTLTNPFSTGLVPYDLEAPAKLLTPRPTPLRNSIPRIKGQGGARRFKVISGFTGTSTGGATTVQPGISESSTNAGPGGLSYIRGPRCGVAA